MVGASDTTLRVRFVNANYESSGVAGMAGTFAFMVVTEDDERHVLEPAAGDVPGLVALVRTEVPLLWDAANRTLIAANLVGQWLPDDWSGVRP